MHRSPVDLGGTPERVLIHPEVMDDPERRGAGASSRPGRAGSDSPSLAGHSPSLVGRAEALRARLADRAFRSPRRAVLVLVALLLIGLVLYALSRLSLGRFGHALVTASPGWIALALALMALSLLLRAVSWHEALRAALPATPVGWIVVARATMIGVMASAVVPGRIGEPTRIARALAPSRGALASRAADRRRHRVLADADQPARARDPRGGHLQQRPRPRAPRGDPRGRGGTACVLRCSCCWARACCASAPRSRIRAGAPGKRGDRSAAGAGPARSERVRKPALRGAVGRRPAAGLDAAMAACYVVMLALGAASPRRRWPPPPRCCWRSTSARSCPRPPPMWASSRPPAWSCSPLTASAPVRRSHTASSCRRSRC